MESDQNGQSGDIPTGNSAPGPNPERSSRKRFWSTFQQGQEFERLPSYAEDSTKIRPYNRKAFFGSDPKILGPPSEDIQLPQGSDPVDLADLKGMDWIQKAPPGTAIETTEDSFFCKFALEPESIEAVVNVLYHGQNLISGAESVAAYFQFHGPELGDYRKRKRSLALALGKPSEEPPAKRPAGLQCGCCKREKRRTGHELRTCPFPDKKHGDVAGCPACNTRATASREQDGTHNLDDCQVILAMPAAERTPWLLKALIDDRANKPPIRSTTWCWPTLFNDWVTQKKLAVTDSVEGRLPWTRKFSVEVAQASRTYVKGSICMGGIHPRDWDQEQSPLLLPRDPFWSRKTVGDVLQLLQQPDFLAGEEYHQIPHEKQNVKSEMADTESQGAGPASNRRVDPPTPQGILVPLDPMAPTPIPGSSLP